MPFGTRRDKKLEGSCSSETGAAAGLEENSCFSETEAVIKDSLKTKQLVEMELFVKNSLKWKRGSLAGQEHGGSWRWRLASGCLAAKKARTWRLREGYIGSEQIIGINAVYLEEGVESVCKVSARKSTTVSIKLAQEEVEALVDSGATVSMVSAEFARSRQLLLDKAPPNMRFKAANSKTIEVCGTTILEFQLGGRATQSEFVVAEGLIHNVILGANILRTRKVDILFSKGCIRIDGEEIPMKTGPSYSISAIEQARPSDQITLDGSLNDEETVRLKSLVDEYQDIFSSHDEDIGASEFIHKIDLLEYKPIRSRAYRIPHSQKTVESEEIQKMIRMGVIQRSSSDFPL